MKPTDKLFKILKIDKHPSRYNREFYYVFFKSDSGASYRTCLDPANRNFQHWQHLMKVGNVLSHIGFKNYQKRWIIDADSHPRLDHYEELPSRFRDLGNQAPAPQDDVQAPQPKKMPEQSALFDIPAQSQSKGSRRSAGAH